MSVLRLVHFTGGKSLKIITQQYQLVIRANAAPMCHTVVLMKVVKIYTKNEESQLNVEMTWMKPIYHMMF